jgi:hypothetical protein
MTELERGDNLRVFFEKLNVHSKECISFDGYSRPMALPQDDYWEIKVECECGRIFSLIGEGGFGRSYKSTREYCEASKMFSKSTREEAIASQVHGEDVLCPILGVFYDEEYDEEIFIDME